jgi:hypothetical protein
VPDELPPEALAAVADGEPEQTANASNDDDGPEGVIEDADQEEIAEGSVIAAESVASATRVARDKV